MDWIVQNWQIAAGWGGSTVLVTGAILFAAWKATVTISRDIGLFVGTANVRLDTLESGQRFIIKDMASGFREVHERMDNHLEGSLARGKGTG